MIFVGNIAALLLPILLPGLLFIVGIKRNWSPVLNVPIDGGRTLAGHPIFGRSKTWRGIFFYVVGATAVCWVLHAIAPIAIWVPQVFHAQPLLLGPAWGLAYSSGELANSFVKRRLGIGAGQQATSTYARRLQAAADNMDGALAAGLVLLAYRVDIGLLLATLAVSIGTHAGTDILMRRLRLKRR